MGKDSEMNDPLWEAFDDAIEDEGFQIEGYEVVEEIARGGMGVVYLARQHEPDREVALKVMLPRYADEPGMRRRFATEARAMAALDHPGILPVYEVGESAGLPYFSMKLASGGDLSARLGKIAMPPAEAAAFACEIGAAVHYAHQHGVLHRDLKPGNFLFDSNGRIYVSDFGVAKMLDSDGSLTRTRALVGTPYYMPPEIAGGSASEATVVGDLYSLGAVLYECLTGKRPHSSHENVASLLRAIVDEEILPVRTHDPTIPGDLEVICMKALEEDPRARYGSVADFTEDLTRWQEGRTINARPANLAEQLWRWVRRHPVPSALAAGLVVTAITGTVLLSISYRQTRAQLRESLIAQAGETRGSARPGFRTKVLGQLTSAAAIALSPEIRDEAVALFAKTDFFPAAPQAPPIAPDLTPPGWKLITGSSADLTITSENAGYTWEPAPGYAILAKFVPGTTSPTLVIAGAVSPPAIYSGEAFADRTPLALTQTPGFLAIAPDGKRIVFGGSGGTETVAIPSGETISRVTGRAMRCPPVWSPSAITYAASLGDRKQVALYDARTGEEHTVLPTSGWPERIAFHPSGELLAVASRDGALEIFHLPSRSRLAQIITGASEVQFSAAGEKLFFRMPGANWQTWDLHLPTNFREWDHQMAPPNVGTVFKARLSPDGKHLLTSTTAGIGLWSVTDGILTSFYPVENQRLDARTSAWWIGNKEVLIQIPGALERLTRTTDSKLTFGSKVNRPPGSTVIDVLTDGNWLVDAYDEDEERIRYIWPSGNFESALPASQQTSTPDTKTSTNIIGGRSIFVGGPYQFTLTPPTPTRILQVVSSRDSSHVFAIGEDHRVLEWDVGELDAELRQNGFK